jgi:signal transduction histidine kinase
MTSAHDSSGASKPRPKAAAPDSLRKALDRAREERDDALRHALEAEQQRDLSHELALRFEREFEEQRRALAQALHDELGHHAMAIRTIASTLENRLADREPSLAQLARLMVRNAEALSASVRSLVRQVRPEPLEHGGLLEGLRSLLADWALRQPAIRFQLFVDPPDDAAFGFGLPDVEAAAWRIVAESVENAVEHAGPGTVVVSVRRGDGVLTIQVGDDGRGLVRRRVDGAGMQAIRERAAACGGSVSVANGESGGVEVLASLPWPGRGDAP